KWLGAYLFDGGIVRHISVENGQLYSLREGSSKLEIYPMSKTHFIFDGSNTAYEFSEKDGKKQVAFTGNGTTTIGIETDKAAPTEQASISLAPEILITYVGKYELAPGMVMDITAKDTQLFAQLTG